MMSRDDESREDHGTEDGFHSGLKAPNWRPRRLMEKMAEKQIKLISNAHHIGLSSAYLYGHGPLSVHMV